MAIEGSFTATGASEALHPIRGSYSYRLNCAAYTSGTANYKIGRTEGGRPCFSITGTWVGTINLQQSSDRGANWDDMPDDSYTTNQAKVIE